MKRMLINATQPEELRVAMVDGQRLYDLDIETVAREQKKANIYKGRITRIEPSLEAAFVDHGAERHGFLPLKEVARSYFKPDALEGQGRPSVIDALKEGQELIVQVEKEERGNKGAALTTFVSLAGRYLVLMPNNPRAGGVSRRIEGADRSELRDALSALEIPDGMGLIIRTAGVGRSVEELQWDMDYLLHLWSAIERAAERNAPFLIYQESNLIIRALRDYLRPDIGEIQIDDAETHRQAQVFMEQVMPHNLGKVKLYTDTTPLFSRYQIESQIESAFNREVRLPSGGAIVIDHTEALTTIDVNSSRATKGGDIEETALNTNLEVVEEVARQLRLRDTGGLIVIDFIDMTPARNQREVENRLKEALKQDRARIQISRISRFGLLEMSRQRLRPSLGESSQIVCPRCSGQGTIRSVESLALAILRLVEEEAMKANTARVVAQLPIEVSTFLLNEKRDIIHSMEQHNNVRVLLLPNQHLTTPQYQVTRQRPSDVGDEGDAVPSYELIEVVEEQIPETTEQRRAAFEEPAVKTVAPKTPAPPRTSTEQKTSEEGFLKRLLGGLFGNHKEEKPQEESPAPKKETRTGSKGSGKRSSRSDSRGQRSKSDEPRGRRRGGQGSRQGQRQGRGRSGEENRESGGKKRSQRQRDDAQETKKQANEKQRSQSESQNAAESEQTAQQERSNRSRNRRGRRGGRRRNNRSEAENTQNTSATDSSAAHEAQRKAPEENVPGVPLETNEAPTQRAPKRQHAAKDRTAQPNAEASKQNTGPKNDMDPRGDKATHGENAQQQPVAEKPQGSPVPDQQQKRADAPKTETASDSKSVSPSMDKSPRGEIDRKPASVESSPSSEPRPSSAPSVPVQKVDSTPARPAPPATPATPKTTAPENQPPAPAKDQPHSSVPTTTSTTPPSRVAAPGPRSTPESTGPRTTNLGAPTPKTPQTSTQPGVEKGVAKSSTAPPPVSVPKPSTPPPAGSEKSPAPVAKSVHPEVQKPTAAPQGQSKPSDKEKTEGTPAAPARATTPSPSDRNDG